MNDFSVLSRLHVRHLLVLKKLNDLQSVTETAVALCLTPSAVSKLLAQLREMLEDELFYRQGNQLLATARARHLAPVVNALLRQMEQLLNDDGFQPQTYTGNLHLALRESSIELFAPALMAVQRQAPGMKLSLQNKDKRGLTALLEGKIELLILPHDLSQPPTDKADLVWQPLLDDAMCCLMHPRHPLADGPLTLDRYLSYPHVSILDEDLHSPFFEQTLAQQQRRRHLAVEVSDFGSAASLCHHSELLFTCSYLWATQAAQAKGLITKSLPFDYGKVAYSLVWHQSSEQDAMLCWFRQALREALTPTEALSDPLGATPSA